MLMSSAVLGLPAISLMRLSIEEKTSRVLQITADNPTLVLRFFLYHVHDYMRREARFVDDALSIDLKSASGREETQDCLDRYRRRSLLGDPTLMSTEIHKVFGFRTERALLEFLRFHPERTHASVTTFLEARRELASCADESASNAVLARRKAELALEDFRAEQNQFSLINDHTLVEQALEIVQALGTNQAVYELINSIHQLCSSGDCDRAFKLGQIIDHARGTSLMQLADLEMNAGKCERCFNSIAARQLATKMAANRFAEVVRDEAEMQGNKKIDIATSGISTTVLEGILAAKDHIGRVYIIESDDLLAKENRRLKSELLYRGVDQTDLIDEETARSPYLQTKIAIFVVGFEMMTADGHLVHPKGADGAAKIFSDLQPNSYPKKVALGESWKIRDNGTSRPGDPGRVSIYLPCNISVVITDAGIFDKCGGTFDLRYCLEFWQSKLSTNGTRVC